MPILHEAFFVFVIAAVVFAIGRWRMEPVLALLLAAGGFGVACGLSVGQIGKSFGTGFGAVAAGPGLAVVAATLIGSMAEAAGATQSLAALMTGRGRLVAWATPVVGLLAGVGASPASAFALLRPLGVAAGANPIRLALAMVAGQGLLLPSPVMIAATSILAADWRLVLAVGLPCAILMLVATAWVVRLRPTPAPDIWPTAAPRAWTAAGFVAVSIALVTLLIVQSFGDIPSEPFGGGSARELLLGLGRPFILLLVGLAGMAAISWRAAISGAAQNGVIRAAPMLLLLGAAGGLQAMAEDSRMADSLAETISSWNLGLFVPFLVAACLKMLLGSSSVASISAAGLLQSSLAGLGLDDPAGHAFAALAVGAGAVSGTHVNDAFFWIVTDAAKIGAGRAMIWVFGMTLLQGAVATILLWGIRSILPLVT